MRRRGLILLAGTIGGILPCAVATSPAFAQAPPSSVINTQVQLGDVFSSQTLNVETITDQATGTSTAAANSYQASTGGSDLDLRSDQTAARQVAADNRLNVAAASGAQGALTTTAAGNSGEAGVTGGVLTAVIRQTTDPTSISAVGHIEAPDAEGRDVAVSTQAQGNAQLVSLSAATAGGRVEQVNAAQVTSDGGGVYGLVTGQARFDAATEGNAVNLNGDQGSGARIDVSQANTTSLTQAAQFTAFGQAQEAHTTATAFGNNINAVNRGFLMDAKAVQHNQSYLRAQADGSAAAFGSLEVSATGFGNQATVGDIGGEVALDTSQLNEGGGIEVLANVTGGDGYDVSGAASAAGNSVTGYACADCHGRMSVTNAQVNNADVGAMSTTTVTGQARSAVGAAHAVGNSATYYVSRPSGG